MDKNQEGSARYIYLVPSSSSHFSPSSLHTPLSRIKFILPINIQLTEDYTVKIMSETGATGVSSADVQEPPSIRYYNRFGGSEVEATVIEDLLTSLSMGRSILIWSPLEPCEDFEIAKRESGDLTTRLQSLLRPFESEDERVESIRKRDEDTASRLGVGPDIHGATEVRRPGSGYQQESIRRIEKRRLYSQASKRYENATRISKQTLRGADRNLGTDGKLSLEDEK